MEKSQTVVVLGGYGLIGSACVRALKADGFSVVGVGRSLEAGKSSDPEIVWHTQDLAAPFSNALKTSLATADVVVNASGALQTGLRDNLMSIHEGAIAEIVETLSGTSTKIVQISAAGVSETAKTEFMRTKFQGDGLLINSNLDWIILRPTLVIGAQAYGGTALLRSASSFPVIGVNILPDVRVQTIYLEDVAQAVLLACRGEIASRTIADLTEHEERSLFETIAQIRSWQGFDPWALTVTMPVWFAFGVAKVADILGWLGWRSPLRTTVLKSLEQGVVGDPSSWEAAGGFKCRSFCETLKTIPSSVQERWFSRLYLILPVVIAILSVFWLVSGLIGLISTDAAVNVLTSRGSSSSFAHSAVMLGAAVDIAVGLAVLVRPWTRLACIGMIAVSISYLIGASFWAPDLWLDPLGPLVKVIPTMALPIFVMSVLEKR